MRRRNPLRLLLLSLLLWLPPGEALGAAPRVVVSLVPLQALVGALMVDVGEPVLLLPGGASPHSYALKPSQMQALQQAELVFWIGPGLEVFLERPLAVLPESVKVVSLVETPNLQLLPTRQGGVWNDSESDEEHPRGAHHQAGVDQHVWLSPSRTLLLAEEICRQLVLADPAHAGQYQANLALLSGQIAQLKTELQTLLSPLRDRPYLVFHDAYRYFEDEFGLRPVGAVAVNPERAPGARRLRELQAEIAQRNIRCLFREPQFPPRLVDMLTTGSGARVGVLDPLGAELAPGADAYLRLMRQLADSLQSCLQ